MIPHEREMVKKFDGKPFALVSISADAAWSWPKTSASADCRLSAETSGSCGVGNT